MRVREKYAYIRTYIRVLARLDDETIFCCKMLQFWATVFTLVAVIGDAECQEGLCSRFRNDQTLFRGATGTDVVLETVRKLQMTPIGIPNDGGFLRRMAAVETGDGTLFHPGGIWGVSERVFDEVDAFVRSSRERIAVDARNDPCLRWNREVQGYTSMQVPFFSAMAVTIRLHIGGHDKKIDDDPEEQGRIWLSFKPSGDPNKFVNSVRRLIAIAEAAVAKCEIPGVDMIFVMDDSGSIGTNDFDLMRQLAIDITDNFTIGPQDTQVGWISFSVTAVVQFNLNTYSNKALLHRAMRDVPYSNGRETHIDAGLRALHNEGFVESAGARQSFDIPEVAIVVTDGHSNLKNIQSAATILRENRNVNVFAIGIGGGVRNETLEAIALAGITNDSRHVYHASGFITNELRILRETIQAQACFDVLFLDHEATVDELNDGDVHSVPEGASLHFNVLCPEEGLTINACGREGRIVIYLSSRTNRPSSAGYDRKIEIAEGQCHNTFIECEGSTNNGRRRRQAEGEERIFMTIEGQSEENEYELQAMVGDHSTPQVNLECRKEVTEDGRGLVINCNSDRELIDIDCSINDSPLFSCSLPWTVTFTPPVREYNLEIHVMDLLNLTDSVNITHSVAPLTLLCSLNEDTEIECGSNNELDPNATVCSFRGITIDPCVLPQKIDVAGLPVGEHAVQVSAVDVFGSTGSTSFDYLVVGDRVGDDMAFSTVVDISPFDVGVTSDPTVSLCYQVHGENGKFYNLVSDKCLSINAHVNQPIPEIDINVIDKIGILAVGNNGSCYNIAILRESCSVLVNNNTIPINSRFEEDSVIVFNHRPIFRRPNMIRISIPNCDRALIDTMYVTCTHYKLRGATAPVEVLEFKTTRGLSPIMLAHGLIGQFWGRFVTGQPQTPPSPQRSHYDKAMTIFHETSLKQFNGFVRRGWLHREMCFYAGDRQGAPVIQGEYTDYEVEDMFDTQYSFSLFNSDNCSDII